MIDQKDLKELLAKKLFGTLPPEQEALLDDWRRLSPDNERLYTRVQSFDFIAKAITDKTEDEAVKSFDKLKRRMNRKSSSTKKHIFYIAASAVAAAIIVCAIVLLPSENYVMKAGTNKAVLYSADGGATDMSATDSFRLVTKDISPLQSEAMFYTMVVPRGGEYEFTLEDETAVHLNSESSLIVPATFSVDKRIVNLTGEAYFDVHSDREHPFIVETDKAQIKVCGTSFNVKNHKDEKCMVVTLESGSIEVKSLSHSETLAQGEQAMIFDDGTIEKVKVKSFNDCAWHRNRIVYENKPLDEILADLGLWYDFDVEYADERLRTLRFSMDIERSANFNDVAELLEKLDKIKVVVSKNKVEVK